MFQEEVILQDKPKKFLKVLVGIAVILAVILSAAYFTIFAAPDMSASSEQFIVPQGNNSSTDAVNLLEKKGFFKNRTAFQFALGLQGSKILPGGYRIAKSMNVFELARAVSAEPPFVWVTIPEGLRKEEIAEIIGEKIGWDEPMRTQWITVDTADDPSRREGVYFPDTYLIPKDESGKAVAKRLRMQFEEKFAPYAQEAIEQNIKWTTVVNLASIVEREAAGKDDMSLIAGILWNRLEKKMKLDVDATLQYARGETDKGWWAPLTRNDKEMESPYNTYRTRGLPPTPISNPGLAAIAAVLHPKKTDCLYYLHDGNRAIHCAKAYEEHRRNIEKYLK